MFDPLNNNVNQTAKSNPVQPGAQPQQASSAQAKGTSFSEALDQANVKFSNHAQKRLEVRSIEMDANSMDRLSSAVDKAQAHGAKESLILMDDLAFIVNVQDRMVVTTVDMNRRKEGVFTQIDTVVFADPNQKSAEVKNDGELVNNVGSANDNNGLKTE